MHTYYAASTGGFYIEGFHDRAAMPEDAMALVGGDAERLSLLDGMARNKRIVPNESGYPILQDNPPVSDEEFAQLIRQERTAKLRDSDWSQLSDVPESVREAWATYRQALRDIPAQPGFPLRVEWPASPDAN
ncbi:tail fiber assembly protein [Achromobacter denitrificans]|uniref:Phage tail assembly chaperone-like domain-containing protein n=1 Tax=Achromobacter denitrificans TaxID=32002 RepID=A0A6N0JI93_ACHDE|nr:tail fiber assembly protein [Achromobacter denitrificans]QKQ46835.1 hypothetical protein FOC81_09085 [Achromobacter denitrificans]